MDDSIKATGRIIEFEKSRQDLSDLNERETGYTDAYLRTIFNSVYDAIFIHDFDGTIIDVNDKMLEMYQVDRENAKKLSIRDDYSSPHNPLDQLPPIWQKVISGENQFFKWIARRPKDGSVFDVEVFLRRLSLAEKDVILANVRDITERRRAEKELYAEKQKFQTLSESAPFGMVVIDRDNTFKYINPKFRELFGYDLSEVPTVRSWFNKTNPNLAYRHQVVSDWLSDLKALNPGEGRPHTNKVLCKDGTEKIINFIPVQLETGEILMTCEDITNWTRAEDEIRRRNLELAALNDIIASVSRSIRLSELLGTLKKVFTGQPEIPMGGIFLYDEPSNRTKLEISWGIPDASLQEFENIAGEWFRSRRLVHEKEVILDLHHIIDSPHLEEKNSLCIPLLVEGEIQGMILLFSTSQDVFRESKITFFRTLGREIGVAIQNARLFERVLLSREQMQTLSRRLVEVQEAERRYIARELHDEVGQVLTGLKLALEMNVRLSGEAAKASLIEAQSLVNKLMVLIRELSLNLRPAMLDDLGLLPALLWHFERFTAQTNIRVIFKHTGLNQRVNLEAETAIYRIVQEALTNVVRHAKVSEVTVRIWLDEKMLGVQVEDHGIGFNSEALLNTGTSSGLAGMRERAVLLGGQFTIETSPGAGTRLTAELPIHLKNHSL
jgi:PAS domain S-box-containing protein